MNGVEGSFGGLAVSYLVMTLALPFATAVVVARPAVGTWLAGEPAAR